MPDSHKPRPVNKAEPPGATEVRRFLPANLWARWQTGDTETGQQHLRAALRTVATYLPQAVVRQHWSTPHAPAAGGEFAQGTLMFADISGFTAMSEQLTQLGREGAEIITGIVNDYFAAMLEIIARRGGDLFKFGGDALLVCFRGQDAALRACQAAVEMQDAMARFAKLDTEQGAFSLRMKVGIGTDIIFMVSLGTPDRLEFAVMGPALAKMARGESLATAGEVLIDAATFEAAGKHIQAEPHAPGFFRLVNAHTTGQAVETSPPEIPLDPHWLLERLNALSPYVPPRVLEQIIASPGQQMIEGEHRLATVLFANFYGIDPIIVALGPDRAHEITAILNRHFTTMQRIIHSYGGIVNKVDTYAVGYRIMAVFGAPVAHEDDPARAVHTALDMQAAMKTFAELETSQGRFALKQRIGINTGFVFAGNLGSALRQEYSVMGDEVNLAARLMGIAGEGQVLISQSTARHVFGMFEWQARDPVPVKGKKQPVPNYQVLRSVSGRATPTVVHSTFFGRHKELATAQSLLETVANGTGVVLDLSGNRGMGKSRLVEEICNHAQLRGTQILRGDALSFGRGIPYLPWIGILNTLLEIQSEDPPGKRREKLIAALDPAGLSAWAPIVGSVLGIEMPETPLTASLDAQLRQQRFFDIVVQLLHQHAAQAPLLIVLDDLQWADDVSLDLTTYVARNTSDAPLLLVLVHWPDLQTTPWDDLPTCRHIALGELDEAASLNLARWVLGKGELEPSLRKFILERAQGNPLFVEEVTRALRDSGAIAFERGNLMWSLISAQNLIGVPTTLAGLIMSRLDRLEAPSRRLLQVASVVGMDFRGSTLARIYPYNDLDGGLQNRLNELVQLDLVTLVSADRYHFRQTLTQEVTYDSLSFARRRQLHLRVGEDIESHHAGDLSEQYGVLARHFDIGRAFDKAFTYRVKAGHKAKNEYANDAALQNYRRALEILAEADLSADAEELDILEAMGDVHLLTSRYAEAIDRFQAAIAHRRCTVRRCSDLLRKIAKSHEQQGQYDEALTYLERARRALLGDDADQNSLEMARICDLSGWVHMRRGEIEQAIENCEQGLTISARLEGDVAALRVRADLYNTLGTIHANRGDYAAAAHFFQHSTDLRQHANDLPGLARSYNNLARVAWAQGDLAEAKRFLDLSLDISHQIGNNHALAFIYNNLGAVSYTGGQVEQALQHYDAALRLRQRIGDNFGVAETCSNIGEVHLKLGHLDQARRYLRRSARLFEQIQSEGELPEVYRLLAEVELAGGDVETALDYAARARRIAETIGSAELQGTAERALARCYAQAGDLAHAREAFETSIRLLEASGHQIELARSHYEYGVMLAGQAEHTPLARQHLQRAAELFTDAGATQEAAQARAALPGAVKDRPEP